MYFPKVFPQTKNSLILKYSSYNFENLLNMVTSCKVNVSLWFSLLSSRGKTNVTVKNSGKTLFYAGVQRKKG